jgi:uncharacterized membrane protein YeaQ/YmgE (transglycosylase-associated protein family)
MEFDSICPILPVLRGFAPQLRRNVVAAAPLPGSGAADMLVDRRTIMSGILWIILVGFVAGIIARFLSRGPNNPTGFILTTVLGIAGAFVATFIDKRSDGTGPTRARGLSPRRLAP